jgi:hypothetical protein
MSQRFTVPAGQAAEGDQAGELVAVDPTGAPQIAERVGLELFEQDEWAELLERSGPRRHPQLRSY